jgi:hypothetical protein
LVKRELSASIQIAPATTGYDDDGYVSGRPKIVGV